MEESRAKQISNDLREQMFAPEINAGREAKQVAEELTDINYNTELDCKEFGEHVRNGGWRLGLLVARNVEPSVGGRPKKTSENSEVSKISSIAFARKAGNITDMTVTKYLTAWNLAAADGHVPSSSSLLPGQSYNFDSETHTPELWKKYFKPPAADREKNLLKEVERRYDAATSIEADEYGDKSLFEGRSDYRLKDVYEANLRWKAAVIQKADQISANLMTLAEELGYEEE